MLIEELLGAEEVRRYEERQRKGHVEPLRKGAHTSYKTKESKKKQGALFPDLLAEIEKKREDRDKGKTFTAEDRFNKGFHTRIESSVDGSNCRN